MRGQIGYADALKILGAGHGRTLNTINRLLGGAILATTAATGQIGLLALLPPATNWLPAVQNCSRISARGSGGRPERAVPIC